MGSSADLVLLRHPAVNCADGDLNAARRSRGYWIREDYPAPQLFDTSGQSRQNTGSVPTDATALQRASIATTRAP
jgi:hypothetical protein